ncbi:uncharacterized protein LOC115598761 [Calypte anna]|uniref:uncharacterized protein LOC115598761 n=1 Tax=Calypte anna TaxID=9244 RepID=UPI0011C4A2A2|nr:uncharacterized protein LOC115598761 [Calypte anna]
MDSMVQLQEEPQLSSAFQHFSIFGQSRPFGLLGPHSAIRENGGFRVVDSSPDRSNIWDPIQRSGKTAASGLSIQVQTVRTLGTPFSDPGKRPLRAGRFKSRPFGLWVPHSAIQENGRFGLVDSSPDRSDFGDPIQPSGKMAASGWYIQVPTVRTFGTPFIDPGKRPFPAGRFKSRPFRLLGPHSAIRKNGRFRVVDSSPNRSDFWDPIQRSGKRPLRAGRFKSRPFGFLGPHSAIRENVRFGLVDSRFVGKGKPVGRLLVVLCVGFHVRVKASQTIRENGRVGLTDSSPNHWDFGDPIQRSGKTAALGSLIQVPTIQTFKTPFSDPGKRPIRTAIQENIRFGLVDSRFVFKRKPAGRLPERSDFSDPIQRSRKTHVSDWYIQAIRENTRFGPVDSRFVEKDKPVGRLPDISDIWGHHSAIRENSSFWLVDSKFVVKGKPVGCNIYPRKELSDIGDPIQSPGKKAASDWNAEPCHSCQPMLDSRFGVSLKVLSGYNHSTICVYGYR